MVHFQHAEGRAVLRRAVPLDEVGAPRFSHLECKFPFRLLAPVQAANDATVNAAKYVDTADQSAPIKSVGILFTLGFGGGLISGDRVNLEIDVGEHTRLLMLTQGNTNVYRVRRGGDPVASIMRAQGPNEISRQHTRYHVRKNATLVLLPAPVTCFARSRYAQTQRFDLHCGASSSLILLDWFTSGRLAVNKTDYRIPEFWHFYMYHSRNEVRVNGDVIVRDRQHLAQDLPDQLQEDTRTDLAQRCEPYTCFGIVILYGIECEALCRSLSEEYDQIQQPQPLLRSGGTLGSSRVSPPEVLWSLSPLCSGAPVPGGNMKTGSSVDKGLILRVAGTETDTVRAWLHKHLLPVKYLIGDDMYRIALG